MPFVDHPMDRAQGRWKGILLECGVEPKVLNGRHQACPGCGGKDRFRFTNHGGKGSYICNNCGSGDGIDLLCLANGWDKATAFAETRRVLGLEGLKPDVPKRELSNEQVRDALRQTWVRSKPMHADDLAAAYLRSRGLPDDPCDAIRFAPALANGEGSMSPTLLAVISDPNGKPASMHRTFLANDGTGKASIRSPRKYMKAPIPEGSAIRLSAPREELCVAEGIETALACSLLFATPCWSCMDAGRLAQWLPPAEVRSVTICGDNDASFEGQHAAYALARRLRRLAGQQKREIEVNVMIPEGVGTDWADVLWSERGAQ